MDPSPRRTAVHPALAELRTWRSPSELLDGATSAASQSQGAQMFPTPPGKRSDRHLSTQSISPEHNQPSPRQARQTFLSSSTGGGGSPLVSQGLSPRHAAVLQDIDSARSPYHRQKFASDGARLREHAPGFPGAQGVPPLNLNMLKNTKLPATPRPETATQLTIAPAPVLSSMSLTDMGVDVSKLQKHGVPDETLVHVHRLIIAHSSGFHSGVQSLMSTVPDSAKSEMLHAVWSAFFMAWSTELNIQSSAEIHGMADERNRLTEELTARRHEAMQMRDGIQRLMRDQVDRMLQERQDAKERDMLRSKIIKERSTLRSSTLELQAVTKERDNLQITLADCKLALEKMSKQYMDVEQELKALQKMHRDISSQASTLQTSQHDKEAKLQAHVSYLQAALKEQEARATQAQEQAMSVLASAAQNVSPNNTIVDELQKKVVEQARSNAILRGHVENMKEEIGRLKVAKQSSEDSSRLVLDVRAEFARAQDAHASEKKEMIGKSVEMKSLCDHQQATITKLEQQLEDLGNDKAKTEEKNRLKIEQITRIAAEEASSLRRELTAAAQLNEKNRANLTLELEKTLSRINDSERVQQEERQRWVATVQETQESAAKEIEELKAKHKVEVMQCGSDAATKRSELQSQIDSFSAENSSLVRDLAEIKGTLAETLREKVELAGRFQSALERNNECQRQQQAAEVKLKEVEALLSASERSWSDVYEQLQAEKASRTAAEANSKSIIEKMTLESAGDRARIVQLEARTRTQQEDCDRTATNLHGALGKLGTIGPQFEDLSRDYAASQREIQAIRQRVSLAEEELARKSDTVQALAKELKEVKEYLHSREQVLQDTFALVGSTSNKLQDAQEKVEMISADRHRVQLQLEACEQQAAETKSKLVALTEEMSDKERILAKHAAEAKTQKERGLGELNVEGKLRTDMQQELSRCCLEVLEAVASEAEASLARSEAILSTFREDAEELDGMVSPEAKVVDASRSFVAHVRDQISRLQPMNQNSVRQGSRDPEDAQSAPWGDEAAAGAARKAAYKLVFSTTKNFKSLLSRLQAEAGLLKALHEHQLVAQENAVGKLAVQIAALSLEAVKSTADGHVFGSSEKIQEQLAIHSEEVKSEIAAKVDQCVQGVQHMRAELVQEVRNARKASEEAMDAVKSYKLKLGAAKSVVSLTKGSLDETTSKIGSLRAQLSQGQTEIEELERQNKELTDELSAVKMHLETEIRMKEDIQSRSLTQGEDISVRQREISQLQARIALLEDRATESRKQERQRLTAMLAALKTSQGTLDALRRDTLSLRTAVGQEMQDSAMHLRQDVEQLQKSLIAAHAEESETHKVLANCRAQLTISNRDLDIVATSLGELLSRTEMLVVAKDFRNIECRANIETNQARIVELAPHVALQSIIWKVIETFEGKVSVDNDQHYLLKEQLAEYIQAMDNTGAGQEADPSQLSAEMKIVQMQAEKLHNVQDSIERAGLDVLETVAAYHARLAALDASIQDKQAGSPGHSTPAGMLTDQQLVSQGSEKHSGARLQSQDDTQQGNERKGDTDMELDRLTAERADCAMELDRFIKSSRENGQEKLEESATLVKDCIRLHAETAERSFSIFHEHSSQTAIAQVQQLEQAITAIVAIMDISEQARQELKGQLLQANKDNQDLSHSITAQTREIDRLKEDIAVMSHSNREMQEDNKQLSDAVALKENSVSADDAAALRAKIYQLESTLSTMAGDKKGLEQLLESLNTELGQVNEEAAMVRQKLASMNATEAHLHQLLRESQDGTLAYVAGAQRRSVINKWLAALPNNMRIRAQDAEGSRDVSALMEYDASALLRIAGDVYVSKIMADRVLIEADCSRERLADHMWSFAYFKLGSRYFTELVLQGAVHSLDRHADGEAAGHIVLFRSLLGLDPSRPISAAAEGFFFRFLAAVIDTIECELHNLPLEIARSMEPRISVKAAVKAAELCFITGEEDLARVEQAYSRNISAEVRDLSEFDMRFRRPSELASEIEMKLFELSSSVGGQNLSLQTVLECGMRTFCDEEARESRRLEYLVKTAVTQTAPSMDVPYSAFAKVVEQLNDELHPEEVKRMYREALLNAKPGASMPEMKEFAAVLIRHQCSAIQDPVPMLCHSAQSSERPTLQDTSDAQLDLELGQTLLWYTWKSSASKIESILRAFALKYESIAAELDRLEADQISRELQQLQQSVAGIHASADGQASKSTMAWDVFSELLTRLQRLYRKLPWVDAENRPQSGAAIFVSLFGGDDAATPSPQDEGAERGADTTDAEEASQ